VIALLLSLILSFTPTTQNGGSIKGKVENERGKVFQGVKVTARNKETGRSKDARTNDKGEYTITDLEPGSYTISFEADGYQTGTLRQPQEVEAGKTTTIKQVKMVKENAYALIRGSVFTEQGLVFPGAKVIIERVPVGNEPIEKFKSEYTTNTRGEFAFKLPPLPARYRLTATFKGFKDASKEVEVDKGEGRSVSLILEKLK